MVQTRLVLLCYFIICSLLALAQKSGGQITRQKKTTVSNKKNSSSTKINTSTTHDVIFVPYIQPSSKTESSNYLSTHNGRNVPSTQPIPHKESSGNSHDSIGIYVPSTQKLPKIESAKYSSKQEFLSSSLIQPTPINEMPKYNVVIASFSVLKNARDSYLLLKNEGYPSLIFWDANKNVYRIIIGSTKKKKDAISLLSMYKQTYPDAWILYVYKGKVKEKYNNNESSGIWNDGDYNVRQFGIRKSHKKLVI